jgi:N-hydroxyarylamine O-acetyltransferase
MGMQVFNDEELESATMIDQETLLQDFGTWVTAEEARYFLERLGIHPATLALDYDSLSRIVSAVIMDLPFHNLFLLTRHPHAPTCAEIRADMLGLRGGPCGTMNPFLGALLRVIGFETTLVSASMMEPHCHLGLVVSIDQERYYVDAGDGKPYFEPMRVGDRHPRIGFGTILKAKIF